MGTPRVMVAELLAGVVAGGGYLHWRCVWFFRNPARGRRPEPPPVRIGWRADLLAPWREGLRGRIKPGGSVRAGETILVQ